MITENRMSKRDEKISLWWDVLLLEGSAKKKRWINFWILLDSDGIVISLSSLPCLSFSTMEHRVEKKLASKNHQLKYNGTWCLARHVRLSTMMVENLKIFQFFSPFFERGFCVGTRPGSEVLKFFSDNEWDEWTCSSDKETDLKFKRGSSRNLGSDRYSLCRLSSCGGNFIRNHHVRNCEFIRVSL